MDISDPEREALAKLRAAGRAGAALFAMSCIERLRPLLDRVPSGAPALVAGVALTQLWRVLEGAERPDPRRLRELSSACWSLVEVEAAPGVAAVHLELLVAGAHDALETYLSGDPQHAIHAARKPCDAAAHAGAAELAAQERARQNRDLQEIAEAARGGAALPQVGTRLRERAEGEGKKFVAALLDATAT
ncbi:MAG TPA: hypothetical protein VI356_22245 [Myxococcales bacterium]